MRSLLEIDGDVMDGKGHVLVVEDEVDIAYAIREYLLSQGYDVSLAENGRVALDVVEEKAVDLAIVDVMMPVMDGISFLMELRKGYEFPVIMLSAKSEETDKILGLDMGADDYVTKPFRPLELLARVKSHLRRHQRFGGDAQVQSNHVLRVGGLEMNTETRDFTVDGNLVSLTPIEYKILHLLMSYPGRVFAVDEIYKRVWNEAAVNTDTIMVHVRKIRGKIEIDSKNPMYLKVVWGVGYKLEAIRN